MKYMQTAILRLKLAFWGVFEFVLLIFALFNLYSLLFVLFLLWLCIVFALALHCFSSDFVLFFALILLSAGSFCIHNRGCGS